MKKQWFLVAMIFLLVPWLLVGCGISQELYDAVSAERDSLVANMQSVQGELEAAKSGLNSVQSELDSMKSELQSTKGELDITISEFEAAKSELDAKASELSSTKSQLGSTKSELETTKSELESLKAQLLELVMEPESVPPPSTPSIESLTYTNTEHGFSVKYPNGWDSTEGVMDSIVTFTAPSLIEEEFFLNIIIVSDKLDKFLAWTLEDYVNTNEMQFQVIFDDYEKVNEYRTTISDCPANVLEYTFVMEGFEVTQTLVTFFNKDESVAYAIFYTMTSEYHDKYLDNLDLALSSFEFK